MNQQYFNSNWKNKKAFVFTMDVALALIIVAFYLIVSTNLVTQSNKDPYSNLQLVKFGADLIKILDNQNYLDNPSEATLTTQISELLPSYYDIEIIGYGDIDDCQFTVGNIPPEDQFIASAKYYFKSQDSYCYLRYKIWIK